MGALSEQVARLENRLDRVGSRSGASSSASAGSPNSWADRVRTSQRQDPSDCVPPPNKTLFLRGWPLSDVRQASRFRMKKRCCSTARSERPWGPCVKISSLSRPTLATIRLLTGSKKEHQVRLRHQGGDAGVAAAPRGDGSWTSTASGGGTMSSAQAGVQPIRDGAGRAAVQGQGRLQVGRGENAANLRRGIVARARTPCEDGAADFPRRRPD